MAEEALRLQAEVVDRFSRPLRDLQQQLRNVQAPAGTPRINREFVAVGKSAAQAAREIQNNFAKSLTGLSGAAVGAGVAGASLAAALAGIALAVRSVAGSTFHLEQFSRGVGVSTDKLREFEHFGQRFGISAETIDEGLKNFSDRMYEVRRGVGDTFNFLNRADPAFAQQLRRSKDEQEAFGRALNELDAIKDPTEKRKYSQHLFGTDEFAKFGGKPGELLDAWKKVQQNLGTLPRGLTADAKAFHDAMSDVSESVERLKTSFGADFLPAFTKALEGVRDLLNSPEFKRAEDMVHEGIRGILPYLQRNRDAASEKAHGDYFGPKLEEARKKLAEFDAETARRGGAITPAQGAMREAERNTLEENVRRLETILREASREGVKEGVKEALPLIQPQSFDGSRIGSGGAKIFNASLGGSSLPRLAYRGGGGAVAAWEGGRGGSAGAATRAAMMSYAMDQLRKEGVPEEHLRAAAAHLVGQADMESGLDPNKRHDGGTGFGIYGARDPSPGRGRKTDMLRWLKANGYAMNSAKGQMEYMVHEAMTGNYPHTRAILRGANPQTMARDSWGITHEFESPRVDNDRSGAVGRAYRTGPDPAISRMGDSLMRQRMGEQTVKGDATLSINLGNLPRGTKLETQMNGMFREIRTQRGHPMAEGPMGEDI